MAEKSLGKKITEFLVGTSVQERLAQQDIIASKPSPARPTNTHKGLSKISSRRSSIPSIPIGNTFTNLQAQYRVVQPDWVFEVIPVIRKLIKVNPDMGQAVHNVITLGNTGHKIFFDRSVGEPLVQKMRAHLKNRQDDWASGQAGMNGVVNKMFAQLLIGGALSNEWVPNIDLNGIQAVILVNPEDIRFKLEKNNIKYSPYQRVKNNFLANNAQQIDYLNLVKLNPQTYKYYALNGDTEIPYGFPPYLAAMERIESQTKMNTNIDFVVDQLGMLGFLQALIGKPDKEDGETNVQYDARLDQLLAETKARLNEGVKDGSVIGFQDDAAFDYHSISKGYDQALALFKNNELQIASGLKQDATLWGRDYNTSETQITVIFIKMLSELANIQNIIKTNLEFGYALELRLAGFNFDSLEVKFNRSTLQDDYKYQQGQELKIKNVKDKMIMGIINQDQAADELDYDEPAEAQPMVSWDVLAGQADPPPATPGAPTSKAKRQGQKNKSAKKTRSTNKPISKNK